MRPLDLHVSALNDDEYTFYTTSLSDLALQADDAPSEPHNDAFFHNLSVGVRETRAWLRGRFSNVPAPTVDSILKLFHHNFNQADSLSGGQFFAALRLVLHVQSGKQLDRALVFVQAHPLSSSPPPSRPVSPSKWSVQSQPPPPPPLHPDTPIRRLNQVQGHPPITSSLDVADQRSPPANPFSPTTPSTHIRAVSSTNPFVAQKQGTVRDVGTDSPSVPPLPPRKPVPPIPHTPPPRHASMLHSTYPTPSIKTSLSAPAHSSPPATPQKPVHVTSSLMRQSLQASKAAQTIKRAEEELDRERVLSVLKRSRAGSNANLANGAFWKNHEPGEDITSEPYLEYSTNVPPLPRRRIHQAPSPPPSSSTTSFSTASSTEHIDSNSLDRSRNPSDNRPFPRPLSRIPFAGNSHFSSRPLPIPNQPPRVLSPERSLKTTSPLSSPTQHTVNLPQPHNTSQVYPPPTHPDRKLLPSHSSSTDSFDLVYPDPEQPREEESTLDGSPSQPINLRMSRSKSLHHPSPPIPPPRRKRPESVQLTPTSDTTPPADTEDATGGSPFDASPSPSRRKPRLSRNLSLSIEHDRDASPMMNIQRTIAKLDALPPRLTSSLEALQPRLDRARYKAEAGLSWRGYLNHHGLAGKRDEGEKGLMRSETGNGSETSSANEEERDDLKWPAGEGWHRL